jgi:hypothetical protein
MESHPARRPIMHLTDSFHRLLNDFRSVFTNASFLIFLNMMTGWILSRRRRFVTDLIQKEESSFADMLTTLRRLSWREKVRTVLPKGRWFNKSIDQILDFVSLAG